MYQNILCNLGFRLENFVYTGKGFSPTPGLFFFVHTADGFSLDSGFNKMLCTPEKPLKALHWKL